MLSRHLLTRIVLTLGVAFTWFVVLMRIQPWPFSDYGVFLAVARRLEAGDVLYQGVWDNKDPFVYYSLALVQGFGQPALWALEALWFLLASGAIYAIGRHFGLSRNWSILIGGILVPIALIPFHYFPGTTHLPGVALTLVAIAACVRSRSIATGIALGVLFFFKLSMLPIALAAIAVLIWRRHTLRTITPISISAFVTIIAGGAIVAVRGEFGPYLDSLLHNFTYSQTNTESGETSVIAVLSERLSVFSDVHVLITAATIAVALAITFSQARRSELWLVTATSFFIALASIAVIGKFPHHAQVLGVSAALALLLLPLTFTRLRESRPFISAVLLLIVALALTGGPYIKGYRDALRNPQGTWTAMTTVDPATSDLLSSGPPGSFAIVAGAGMPRSPGLEDWRLACRHLAQRPWESDELLQESLDCFPTAEVLLVPLDFSTVDAPKAFSRFTQSVAQLLEDHYSCVPGIQHFVCTRLDASEDR